MLLQNKSLKKIASDKKKKRRLILAVMLFTLCSLLFSFFFGEMGLVHFNKMNNVKQKAQLEIKALERENGRLLHEIEGLKYDPFYVELLARDRLGMSKKGELIYEFRKQ